MFRCCDEVSKSCNVNKVIVSTNVTATATSGVYDVNSTALIKNIVFNSFFCHHKRQVLIPAFLTCKKMEEGQETGYYSVCNPWLKVE